VAVENDAVAVRVALEEVSELYVSEVLSEDELESVSDPEADGTAGPFVAPQVATQ
jgi:hypothetical protein